MINNDFNLKDKGVSNAFDTVGLPRHRWYYYKEGFSPELVKKAVETQELKPSDLLIDPFNGSGTVTLTAASLGINSIGFEVNPFTNFLAKTKTLSTSRNKFSDQVERVVELCKNGIKSSYLEGYSTFSEHNRSVSKWLFNTEVLRAFNAGYQSHKLNRSNESALIKLGLISAAMANCNAKKDGKCLRYKTNWKNISYDRDSFIQSFMTISNDIYEDLSEKVEVKTKTINGDSRKLINKIENNFKLCITSPPYLNTFDYTDIYRPELFLGEFVTSGRELYNLRLKTVRSHIQANWKKPNDDLEYGMLYREILSKIKNKPNQLMHKNIPSMINAYFEDMKNIMFALKKKAAKGASLWMIVSTSAYADEHIPVDLILADIGTQLGWSLKEIGVLRNISKRMTKHSPNIDKLRESVVIFSN